MELNLILQMSDLLYEFSILSDYKIAERLLGWKNAGNSFSAFETEMKIKLKLFYVWCGSFAFISFLRTLNKATFWILNSSIILIAFIQSTNWNAK